MSRKPIPDDENDTAHVKSRARGYIASVPFRVASLEKSKPASDSKDGGVGVLIRIFKIVKCKLLFMSHQATTASHAENARLLRLSSTVKDLKHILPEVVAIDRGLTSAMRTTSIHLR